MNKKDEKFNPFPGLRPFNPDENDFFFGRDNESEEIAEKLITNRFIAVIGASGAGKSSIINCGLLPKIKSLSSNNNAGWKVFSVKPGSDPLGNLAGALVNNKSEAGEKPDDYGEILDILRENPDGIAVAIEKLFPGTGDRNLLIIDQFEELFRYKSLANPSVGEGETVQFVNLITNSVSVKKKNLFTVVAIRSDLISECAQYKKLTQLINTSNYFVPQMNRENLEKVIEGPVLKANARIDPNLVDILINDVSEGSDCLPVLQHALMRTWSLWLELDEPEKPLTYTDYNSIGTTKDTISRHGNSVYEELSTEGKRVCEKLFKLITGKGSDNRGIRYPLHLKSIRSAVGSSDEELFEVINKFRDPSISFLTPAYNVSLNDSSVIDLSHESLMHLWDRLKSWIDEEAYSVQMYLRLSETSELYQQGKATLLKQPDLQLAIDWREKNKPSLPWAQKYNPAFERAMVYLRTSEKEFLEAEDRKLKRQRWSLRRVKFISSILGGLVLLISLAMAGALISRISAEKRYKAEKLQKVEAATQKKLADEFATLAIHKSIESDSIATAAAQKEILERRMKEEAQKQAYIAKNGSQRAEMTAKTAVEQKIETGRLRMISLAKSMSLRSLQLTGQNDLQALLAYQAYLFNRKNNGSANDADIYQGLYNVAKSNGSANYKSFSGKEGNVNDVAFIPGKKEFFTSGSDGRVLRWNLSNREQSYQVVYSDSEIFGVLDVSPDAEWLACGGKNAGIKMIPINGNEIAYDLKGHTGEIKSLIFSFDGKYLYSAALDGKVLKWDLSAKTSVDIATGLMQITSIDLSSNNKYIAGVGADGKALIWNPGEIKDNFRIESAGKTIKTLRFKPEEERVAVGYNDGTIELWDIPSRKLISEFKAHSGDVNGIKFNNNPVQIATSGSDGLMKLWDANDLSAIPITFTDHGGLVLTFEFSPDGEVLVSGDISEKPKLVARPTYADAFAADGCLYVTRNFAPEEWLAYVGKDIEYEKTCPDADSRIKIREIR